MEASVSLFKVGVRGGGYQTLRLSPKAVKAVLTRKFLSV